MGGMVPPVNGLPVRREIRGVDAMHATDGIAAWRWWTPTELDSTTETVWPTGLATLIRDVLA